MLERTFYIYIDPRWVVGSYTGVLNLQYVLDVIVAMHSLIERQGDQFISGLLGVLSLFLPPSSTSSFFLFSWTEFLFAIFKLLSRALSFPPRHESFNPLYFCRGSWSRFCSIVIFLIRILSWLD